MLSEGNQTKKVVCCCVIYLCEMFGTGKSIETELVVTKGWKEERMDCTCLMGVEFLYWSDEMF